MLEFSHDQYNFKQIRSQFTKPTNKIVLNKFFVQSQQIFVQSVHKKYLKKQVQEYAITKRTVVISC